MMRIIIWYFFYNIVVEIYSIVDGLADRSEKPAVVCGPMCLAARTCNV